VDDPLGRARVEVGRHKDDPAGDGAEDLDNSVALGRDRGRKSQLEEARQREPLAKAIGAAVEPG
jgi:hypothetical protein